MSKVDKKSVGDRLCEALGWKFRYVGLPARRFPCPECRGSGTIEKDKP